MTSPRKIFILFYVILILATSLTPPVLAAQRSVQIYDFPNDHVIVNNIPAFDLRTVDIKSVNLFLDENTLKIEIDYYPSVNVHAYARDHNGEALAETYIKIGRSGGLVISLNVNTTRFGTMYEVTGLQNIPEGTVLIDNVEITNSVLTIGVLIEDRIALAELYALVAAGNLDVYVKTSLLVLGYNMLLSYDEAPSPPPIIVPSFPFPLVVVNSPQGPGSTPADPPLWPTHIIIDLPLVEVVVNEANPGYPGPTDGPNYTKPISYIELTFRISGSSTTNVSHIGIVLDIGSPGSSWLSTTFNIRTTKAGFLDEDGPANGFMIDEIYEDAGVKAKVSMKQEGNWAKWVLEGTIHITVNPGNATSGNETYNKLFRPIVDILEAVNDGDATAQITIIAYTDQAENSGTATTIQIPLSVRAKSQTPGSAQDQASKPSKQVEQTGQTSQSDSIQQEHAQDSQSPAASEPELKDTTMTPPDGSPDDDIELPVPDDDGSRPIPIAFNTGTIALIVISLLTGVVLAILFRRR